MEGNPHVPSRVGNHRRQLRLGLGVLYFLNFYANVFDRRSTHFHYQGKTYSQSLIAWLSVPLFFGIDLVVRLYVFIYWSVCFLSVCLSVCSFVPLLVRSLVRSFFVCLAWIRHGSRSKQHWLMFSSDGLSCRCSISGQRDLFTAIRLSCGYTEEKQRIDQDRPSVFLCHWYVAMHHHPGGRGYSTGIWVGVGRLIEPWPCSRHKDVNFATLSKRGGPPLTRVDRTVGARYRKESLGWLRGKWHGYMVKSRQSIYDSASCFNTNTSPVTTPRSFAIGDSDLACIPHY